ncbi:MAG: Tol-Pal system beta propeller repeat protein TolB [Rickettsiaceae bacterium]
MSYNKISFFKFSLSLIVILFLYSNIVFAIDTINISQGRNSAVPVAINYFSYKSSTDKKIANDITHVISQDLKNSLLFKTIPSSAFIDDQKGISHQVLFTSWSYINANFLLNGEVVRCANNKIKVSVILWDIVLEKNVFAESFESSPHLWRRVAHKIADQVYEYVIGDAGYFDTKIAYVAETGHYKKRVKRIAIMDYDGENHRFLTDGKFLALTPRFSPTINKILYLSYENNSPRVHMIDISTGKEVIVGNFLGMSFAPKFSPDGNKALMSIAKSGSTHIFEIDFNTMRVKQLTQGNNINTSPSYSPDGKKIVFNSDRSGTRQLYVMDSNGVNVKRISFGDGSYATPTWSPRGDYIAFTKITREYGFTIGVMQIQAIDCNAISERIIASGYLVEGPSWAPNGREVIFNKATAPNRNGDVKSKLYMIDITGANEREVKTPFNASDPDWSMTR